MEPKTLEQIIRSRNLKLALWLLLPVGVTYVVVQTWLFFNELDDAKVRLKKWREAHQDRLVQAIFLENEADLRAVIQPKDSIQQRENRDLQIVLFQKNKKLKLNNDPTLARKGFSSFPQGVSVDYPSGLITDQGPLYLADKLQGYLILRTQYPWELLKQQSLGLLLYCLGVFLVLRLGVSLWMLTLRRSLIRPLNWLASGIVADVSQLTDLKMINTSGNELKLAPMEIIRLVNRYNEMLGQIEKLREKEGQYLLGKARVEVAAQVAHDMRSPMAALSLAIESLPPLPGKQKEIFLSVIQRVGEIGEELLRTKRGNLEPSVGNDGAKTMKPVILFPVVESVVREKELLLKSRPGIVFQFPQPSEIEVRANEADLKRALSNLIDNSIEACGEAGEISIKVISTSSKVYLSVKDNGKGIAKENFSQVWKPGVSFGKTNGNGLGLSFVKKVVESWGGRVHLDSALGKGTTISLELLPQ